MEAFRIFKTAIESFHLRLRRVDHTTFGQSLREQRLEPGNVCSFCRRKRPGAEAEPTGGGEHGVWAESNGESGFGAVLED